jgi:lysine 2,3-aminomutase
MEKRKRESKDSLVNDQEVEPGGGLTFRISKHLQRLAEKSPAVARQFYPSSEENVSSDKAYDDPLMEEVFVKTKGLVHKYPGRVLIEVALTCASYCRFCTRRRKVADLIKGKRTREDVDKMVLYLKKHKEVTEVIFSGGDPLTDPKIFTYALKRVSSLEQIKIVRVHTRVPISEPKLMTEEIFRELEGVKKTLYVSLHFEHPDEITASAVQIIKRLRSMGAILLCQSVFLRGVNDDYETLYRLFTRLTELGVRPYYIYRCDPVKGAEHFIVPMEKELKIMTKLRKNLSGIAFPTYLIDTPNGSGKIPVPLLFWNFEKDHLTDFEGKRIKI